MKEFWTELMIRNPRLKYCTILLRNPNDKDILRAILSDHVETEACYFHTHVCGSKDFNKSSRRNQRRGCKKIESYRHRKW